MISYKMRLLQHLKDTDKSAREDFCTQMQMMLEEDGSRLTRKVLNFSSDVDDNRGKHDNHSKVAASAKNRIRKQTEMFPARESHCSRSKNEHKNCLDLS